METKIIAGKDNPPVSEAKSEERARFVECTFEDADIYLTGNEFERCKFVRCKLIFDGQDLAHFDRCLFNEPQFSFKGGAANTLNFLRQIYSLGKGGRMSVEEIFDNVRFPEG